MTTARRGWWRENRLWLAAFPLCVAAAAGASSYNVKEYWYDRGLHHELASAGQGDWLEVTDDYTDSVGATSRTFRVRLTGVEQRPTWPYFEDGPAAPPAGLRAMAVELDWEADPDQQLSGCEVALVDEAGRRYQLDSDDTLDLCTPTDHPGPLGPFGADDDRTAVDPGAARPATWSTTPVFLVPEGRRITGLLVWWSPSADYVQIDVS